MDDALRAALHVEAVPPPVPMSLTPLQARRALRQAGLLAQIETAIAAEGEEAQEEWDYALEIRRDNSTLLTVAAKIGMSDSEIDALFRAAVQV
ncbi:hypothetical protein [Pseudoroseomonas ludipueritiae]|uniref:Uncharacterized protein n=1 Tax=Pseudoroseomonas ludipueritiae TaxID=198093 RepID=A0ABR7R513_9PROT|nr:hypothetical protein [Pseudoroseomonas ludipueritiae]MBC9176757.1 hypothetical protein [Pseudoroseomonas ludipueritiae]